MGSWDQSAWRLEPTACALHLVRSWRPRSRVGSRLVGADVGGGEERGWARPAPPYPPTPRPLVQQVCKTRHWGSRAQLLTWAIFLHLFFGPLLPDSTFFFFAQTGRRSGQEMQKRGLLARYTLSRVARTHTQTRSGTTRPPRPSPAPALGTRPGSRHLAKNARAPCVAHWLKFLHEVAGVG